MFLWNFLCFIRYCLVFYFYLKILLYIYVIRLKKIQDKKKISNKKKEQLKKDMKEANAKYGNMLDEGDEDLLF